MFVGFCTSRRSPHDPNAKLCTPKVVEVCTSFLKQQSTLPRGSIIRLPVFSYKMLWWRIKCALPLMHLYSYSHKKRLKGFCFVSVPTRRHTEGSLLSIHPLLLPETQVMSHANNWMMTKKTKQLHSGAYKSSARVGCSPSRHNKVPSIDYNDGHPHLMPPPPSPSETRTAFSEPLPLPVRREPDVRERPPNNPQNALSPFVVFDTRGGAAGRSTSLAKKLVFPRYPLSFGCGVLCRYCRFREVDGAAFLRPAHAPRHLFHHSSEGASTRAIGRGKQMCLSAMFMSTRGVEGAAELLVLPRGRICTREMSSCLHRARDFSAVNKARGDHDLRDLLTSLSPIFLL